VTILTSLLGAKAFGLVVFLFQAAGESPAPTTGSPADHFSIIAMVKSMTAVGLSVVIVLLIMSIYSIAIMVERYLTYSAAKKQSREFAPRVAQALKNDRIEEAINISDKHRKSHLAMVVSSGLQEFRAHEASSEISGDEIDASKRALQRAIAIKTAEFNVVCLGWRQSDRRRRSWVSSGPCSESSARSEEWVPPKRRVLARSRQVFPKR